MRRFWQVALRRRLALDPQRRHQPGAAAARRWSSRCSSSSRSRAGCRASATCPGFDFPSGYTAFQFVFVLLQAAAFGGVFTGFGIAADFERGFARRLLLAAPNRLGDHRRLRDRRRCARDARRRAAVRRRRCSRGCRSAAAASTCSALVVLAYLVSLAATLFAAAWRCGCARSRPARRCRCRCSSCCSCAGATCRSTCCRAGSHAVGEGQPVHARWSRRAATSSPARRPGRAAYGIAAALVALFAWWACAACAARSRRG